MTPKQFLYYRMVIQKMSSIDNKNGNEGFNRAFISFAIKTIRNGSFNYFRKSSKHWKHENLCLDDIVCTSQQASIDVDVICENEFDIEKLDFSCIESIITDKALFDSVKKLTDRQKEILYYVCIKGKRENEVAESLGITQQAVSNTKQDAVKKIHDNLKKPSKES